MKNILSALLIALLVSSCQSKEEINITDNISEIKTSLNDNCGITANTICNYAVVVDRIEILKIIDFLNTRNKYWHNASTTYPSPIFISEVKTQNKESFTIYTGESWVGLGIGNKQVLQNLSKSDLATFKGYLKVEL
jgi:hypothetical protein